MAYLVLRNPAGPTFRWSLPAAGHLVAGRAPENAFVLPDNRCSRRHFALECTGDRVTLHDLGSANGTMLNGRLVEVPTPLRDGDIIAAGGLELVFVAGEGEAALIGRSDDVIVKPVQEVAASLQGGFEHALQGFRRDDTPGAMVALDESSAITVLGQLARIILSTTTTTELFESAIDLVFQALRVHRVAIFLLDADGRPILDTHRSLDGEGSEFIVSSTILDRAIRERVAITSGDARHDPRFSSGQSIAAWSIRSVLCCPLWNENEVYGVLYLDNLKQQHAFGVKDLQLATGIANLIAIGYKQYQLKEKIKLEAIRRSHLERYHSPDVVNLILNRSGTAADLQTATELKATILFADIKGFTPLSERLRPAELAELLNWYFDLMTRVIFKHKGSVNKFIGDAIMAIFGAPISHGNDAEAAVTAALDMLTSLEDFNAHLEERKRFQIRIGINTGVVIAGDIGARNRMEYTVIGDTVNTAQRLESICRPNAVTIGQRTFEHVRDKFKFRDLGPQTLKGKADAVHAYEVIPG